MGPRGGGRGTWSAIALVAVAGCAPCRADGGAPASSAPLPPRPADCHVVPPGAALQPLVDAAPEGAALCLSPGVYRGPIKIDRPMTLWGPRAAVIRSSGEGTTVRLGAGARLYGVTLDGSGGRYDLLDAAVHVGGDGAEVWGIEIDHAVYGILVERAHRAVVRGNLVHGDRKLSLGLRGDAIRLWEAYDSTVEDNDVEDGRDVVVWYSSGNVVRRNHVRHGRYGTHLMYSHDNTVEDNVYDHDVVGVFVMYSHRVTLRGNLVTDAGGAAGMGFGLKDSGDVTVVQNHVVKATTGLYFDNSPANLDETDTVEGNLFRLCDVGVVFHSSEERNLFRQNGFADNQTHVSVEGGGDAMRVTWDGNYFDDYAGYDLDGDGLGDVPYELRSVGGQLTDRYPPLAFFHGAPALDMADAVTRLVPLYQPKPLLVDPRPAMDLPRQAEVIRAH
jgi:nitrous oxidase accessory protein